MSIRLRTLLAATLLATTATTAAAADPEWIRQFGTGASDRALEVATGPDGRVHVVGETEGRFGAHKGQEDAFVITVDRDGSELWRRQPGTSRKDVAVAVATDADGNVYVVGWTYGALGGPENGEQDAFVIKFDRDGHYVWKRQPGTTGLDSATAVAADADGNVYVVGWTYGALGGAKKGIGHDDDAFVIKFDRDGSELWRRQPGTSSGDGAEGVATDAEGSVYVVGRTTSALGGARKGGFDAFVIKYDRNGRGLWRDQPGTSVQEWAPGVATDSDGNAYVVGHTSGSLPGNTNVGREDAFLIKYGPDGPQ